VNADDERRYVEYVSGRLAWLRKVAYLLCQDWHRADDLAQAAITRLYVHWRSASQRTTWTATRGACWCGSS
jgi:DNA-directed RNA polymerase specialized sigma24 family protein